MRSINDVLRRRGSGSWTTSVILATRTALASRLLIVQQTSIKPDYCCIREHPCAA